MINERLLKLSKYLDSRYDILNIIKNASILSDLIIRHPDYTDQLNLASKKIKSTHLVWVVKQLDNKEPIDEIISMCEEFYKNVQRLKEKDLYRYKTLGELRKEIEALPKSLSENKKQEKSYIDAEVIFKNDEFIVVHPQNKEASIYYGQGTQWCTAATKSRNYFENYSAQNIFLYYIITRNVTDEDDPMNKIAYAYYKFTDKEHDDSYQEAMDAIGEGVEIFNARDDKIQSYVVSDYLDDFYNPIMIKIRNHFNSNKMNKYLKKINEMTVGEFESKFNSIVKLEEQEKMLLEYSQVKSLNKDIQNFIFNKCMENRNIFVVATDIIFRILHSNIDISEYLLKMVLGDKYFYQDNMIRNLILLNNTFEKKLLNNINLRNVLDSSYDFISEYSSDFISANSIANSNNLEFIYNSLLWTGTQINKTSNFSIIKDIICHPNISESLVEKINELHPDIVKRYVSQLLDRPNLTDNLAKIILINNSSFKMANQELDLIKMMPWPSEAAYRILKNKTKDLLEDLQYLLFVINNDEMELKPKITIEFVKFVYSEVIKLIKIPDDIGLPEYNKDIYNTFYDNYTLEAMEILIKNA